MAPVYATEFLRKFLRILEREVANESGRHTSGDHEVPPSNDALGEAAGVGTFPQSVRFEFRQVLSPKPAGPFMALAATQSDPSVTVWLHHQPRAGLIECHVVADEEWIHFSIQDETAEGPVSSAQFEWQILRDYMWIWDTAQSGPTPARPDQLLALDAIPAGTRFKTLAEDGRRRTLRLVRPMLEWWPEVYSREKPVIPSPIRRRINYGPFKRFLADGQSQD